MQDGQNRDVVAAFDEIYGIGEATKQTTAYASPYLRKLLWILEDSAEKLIEL